MEVIKVTQRLPVPPSKEDIIKKFSLTRHMEGGYFAETYRSETMIDVERIGGQRNLMTSIIYMLTDDRPIGYFHKNKSNIMHYFHCGSSLTYLVIHPDGRLEKIKLGINVFDDEVPQLLVRGGCWKATFLSDASRETYGLLGEAVAPGFQYDDMQIANKSLLAEFPLLKEEIHPYIKPYDHTN